MLRCAGRRRMRTHCRGQARGRYRHEQFPELAPPRSASPRDRTRPARRGAAAHAADLTVYTALEADQLKSLQGGVREGQSGLKINWVRDSTGIITAKLLAEKANPQGGRGDGPGRHLAHAAREGGHAAALCAGGLDKINAEDARSGRSAAVGRHGRLGVGPVLQHRRGRQARSCRSRPPGTTSPSRNTRARSPCRTRPPRAPAT